MARGGPQAVLPTILTDEILPETRSRPPALSEVSETDSCAGLGAKAKPRCVWIRGARPSLWVGDTKHSSMPFGALDEEQ